MIHVVLRTCDRHSLQSTRIVNKRECIIRCLNSVINELKDIEDKRFYIIDDNSSEELKSIITSMVKDLSYVTISFLPVRDQTDLSSKKKTRYSLQVAFDYINTIPDEDLVYILEDDYLHFPGSVMEMINTGSLTRLELARFKAFRSAMLRSETGSTSTRWRC